MKRRFTSAEAMRMTVGSNNSEVNIAASNRKPRRETIRISSTPSRAYAFIHCLYFCIGDITHKRTWVFVRNYLFVCVFCVAPARSTTRNIRSHIASIWSVCVYVCVNTCVRVGCCIYVRFATCWEWLLLKHTCCEWLAFFNSMFSCDVIRVCNGWTFRCNVYTRRCRVYDVLYRQARTSSQ